jgi:hypothetical protein
MLSVAVVAMTVTATSHIVAAVPVFENRPDEASPAGPDCVILVVVLVLFFFQLIMYGAANAIVVLFGAVFEPVVEGVPEIHVEGVVVAGVGVFNSYIAFMIANVPAVARGPGGPVIPVQPVGPGGPPTEGVYVTVSIPLLRLALEVNICVYDG